ncbi:MAG: hypothetical protein CYG60_23130 [Actinobacteria bacterium]|nr:MAG: hypothetical protein CYG60_23130 [Actinomycetota bacterium]
MERDTSSAPERDYEPDGMKSGRRREPRRSWHLWSPYEFIEALLYLSWGLGKLLVRGLLDS